jgi:hypothetical protein
VNNIPTAMMMWVPEPEAGLAPRGPQPIRLITELGLLEYKVLVHVTRIEEYQAMEGPAWSRRSPGSDQSGMPSEDSLEEGFWTTRNSPWSAGVQDRRGLHAGGRGGGRQASHGGFRQTPARAPPGRVDWWLPRINGPIHRPIAAWLATNGIAEKVGPALTTQQPNRETTSEVVGHPEASFAVHDPEMVEATLVEGRAQAEKADRENSVSEKVVDPKVVGTAAQPSPNHAATPVQILRRSELATAAMVDKHTDPEVETVGSPVRTLLPSSDPGPVDHKDTERQQELGTPSRSSVRNRIEEAYIQVSLSEGVDSFILGRLGAEDSGPLGDDPQV